MSLQGIVGTSPILIVEDESATFDVVRAYLDREGFATAVCVDGDRAVEAVRQIAPRAVILDVMLPGRDGFQLCEAIRQFDTGLPILMLSARAAEADRIAGLRRGADDYLVKPFSPRELVARVHALLRRSEQALRPVPEISLGNVRVAREAHEVFVDGIRVSLTRFEFLMFVAFLDHPGQTLTRAQLIAQMHGRDADVSDRTVDVHVTRLRDKLVLAGSQVAISTVRGVGYKLGRAAC